MAVLSGNAIVSVYMGTITYTKIMYAAVRIEGTGPGGVMVSERTVANTPKVVGVTHHHKKATVVIGFDEDVIADLISGGFIGMEANNTMLSNFVITEKNVENQTRTVSFAKKYVQSANSRGEDEAEHQPQEITILAYEAITYSAWA
jgi:hypothetical protein